MIDSKEGVDTPEEVKKQNDIRHFLEYIISQIFSDEVEESKNNCHAPDTFSKHSC